MGVDEFGIAFPNHSATDFESDVAVDDERCVFFAFGQFVVFPHGVLEECLQDILFFEPAGVDDVHQVRVVHHDFGRFLGECLTFGVDHIDESRVCQILQIVHYGGARGTDVCGKLAYIGSHGTVDGQQIKQFFQFCQVLELNLFDEQDVHFEHHVHRFQKVLREVAFFKEEWVEPMVKVVPEIFERPGLGQYLSYDAFVVAQDFIQRVGWEVVVRHQVQIFTERESAQVVRLDDSVQFGVFLFQPHHGRTGEDDAQLRQLIVAFAQFGTPVGLFEHLVDEQHLAPCLVKFGGEFGDAFALEIEVVHVDIKAFPFLYPEVFFGVLQQEGRFSHTACTFDTDETVVPVNLVHKGATDRGVGVLHQIGMCSEKRLHLLFYTTQMQR